ncbi:MAG TPA: hypothetical protein VGO71_13965 [Baekduia sp.]|nr:hypothetical protein [Baekduia sp.]
MALARRMLPALLTLTALAGAAALPASAIADPPWTAPSTIPGAAPGVTPLTITASGHGVALAGADRSGNAPAGAASELVPLGLDGRPSGPTRGLTIAAAQLATYAGDRVVVAGSTLDARGTISDSSHVQVAFGSASGALGTLRGLTHSTGERVFALASDAAGDIAVVTGNLGRRRLWVRRPGSSTFRVALTIPVSSRARDATVGVGPRGDVLVVWEDSHHIFTRHIGRTGHAGTRFQVGDGVQSRLQAAIDGSGRELVAWASQRVDEGESATPATVFFATAAPGHGFGTARRLEAAAATGGAALVSAPAVRLVVGPGDATVLSFNGLDGSREVVRAAAVSGGHVGAPQVVSDPARDAVLGDVAVGRSGSAVVLWRAPAPGADPASAPTAVLASVRPAEGRPFAPLEAVTPAGVQVPVAPTVAADPAGGGALALLPTIAPNGLQVSARPSLGG